MSVTAGAVSGRRRPAGGVAARGASLALALVAALPPLPRAASHPETGSSQAAGAGEVHYELLPALSSAGFTLQATLHTVEGTGGRLSGEFRRPARPSPDGWPLDGEIRIEAASLETGNARRDRTMRRDTLDVEAHPLIVFRPRRATRPGGGAPDPPGSQPVEMVLEGDLTIRGAGRFLSIPVTAAESAGRLTVVGETSLNFLDWGVPDPSMLLLRVRPVMTVRFRIEATRADDPSPPAGNSGETGSPGGG